MSRLRNRLKGSNRRKNLKKLDDGNLKNQFGVVFTPEEKKKLENEVTKANYKRKKQLKEEANLPRLTGGKDSGDKVQSLQLMGKESDFIIAQRSKSLQRFKSREQFEKYMKNLERVNSPGYLDERTKLYKRNYMKALENVFGDKAKDVKMKVRMMKPEDFRKMVQQDELVEINYIYDPSQASGKLNQIRQSFGMKLKEEDPDEFMDVDDPDTFF